MIVSRIDPEARSTLAAAEGFRALAVGDTDLARQKYTEAGDILNHASKKSLPASDKHLLRFLAASQFYRAGEYKRADRLVARVNPGHLPRGHRQTLEQFRRDVRSRSSDDYEDCVKFSLRQAWEQHRYQEVLTLLQNHPYVLERAALAFLRADVCYTNRNWKAAALFNSDSIRFSDNHPKRIFVCAAGALALHTTGFVEDAWQYTQELLTHAPNALNYVTACALRFYKLAEGDQPAGLEITVLFDRAKSAFRLLPETTKADATVQEYMAFGLFIAISSRLWFKDREQAVLLAQEVSEFDPNGMYSQAIRTVLTDDATGSEWLFEKTTQVSAVFKERFRSSQEAAIRSIAA